MKGKVTDMEEKQLRELLLERLHLEVPLFKDSMLRKSKADIYAGSYKIELYVNLYEILAVEAERMSEPLLRGLLYQRSGILDAFYEEWLTKDDSFYTELRNHVEDGLEVLSADGADKGKETGYGEKFDKAA